MRTFFFFQAEDGIRDKLVTGVQTCALPIYMRGTVRTFGGKFYDEAPQLIEDTARGIARAFGADAEVRYRRLSKPLVNDDNMTSLMKGVAQDIVGRDRVIDGVRTMGGEDMSYFLARVPGAFAFVGSAPPGKKGSPHHSPTV